MNNDVLVNEWFQFSSNDLISAKHLFEDLHPKQIGISCFLCQQSAEKALKGYLLYNNVEPPKTRDLVLLCQLCIGCDTVFGEILDICSDLTPYGVTVRYPNKLEVDEYLTKIAIGKTERVHKFCKERVAANVKQEDRESAKEISNPPNQ